MRGSPFFVIKTNGKEPSKESMQEVADATCTFSRAWKLGLTTQQVFYVRPHQLEKGSLPKGAFLVVGKTNYINNKINLAIGLTKDNDIMAGPVEAIKVHCDKYVEILPGYDKSSDVAKKVKSKIGGDLDMIIRALPGGKAKVKKSK